MANDASVLQAHSGWEYVAEGQTFTGRGAGFQVLTDGTFAASNQSPKSLAPSFTGVSLSSGFYSGGVILTLTPSAGGSALVYPLDADYTIA